jgi:hypothetical protein
VPPTLTARNSATKDFNLVSLLDREYQSSGCALSYTA